MIERYTKPKMERYEVSILRILVFSIFISLWGCSNFVETAQIEVDKSNFDKPQSIEKIQTCNLNLEEKLRTFYSPIPNEFRDDVRDTKILKEIKNCSREEIIKALLNLQKSKKQDIEIQAKTAYFLVKLNHNRAENGKLLISTYSAKDKEVLERYKDKDYAEKVGKGEFDKDFNLFCLMDLICRVITEDDTNNEFLFDAFDLVLLSDGVMSETLSGTLAELFEKSPEVFFQKLKPKSNEIRQQVYLFLFHSMPEDKVFQHLASIPKDSEVYSLVEEMQKFAKNRKDNN